MSTTINIEHIEEIINNASLEDVTILNERYQQILDDLPSTEESTRYVILKNKTAKRITDLVR